MACSVRGVQNFVVEDGEVEGQTKADGVCWWEFCDGNIRGRLVGNEGVFSSCLAFSARGELSQISVVVSLPIMQRLVGEHHSLEERVGKDRKEKG